jgi:hypothetical protein
MAGGTHDQAWRLSVAKTLFYRLFGLGKIPERFMSPLKSEGILVFDEGIKGSITYRDFRAPGKYSSWRRQWFNGGIVLTQVRLVSLISLSQAIDVPLADERIRSMRFSVEKPGTLLIAFDPALFHPDWSGTMEYRFRTEEAEVFVEKLRERIDHCEASS